jgi:release factor glutamine methyltransferase
VTAVSRPPPDIVARLRAAGCVFAEDEARLLVSAAQTQADLASMVDRRVVGLPLEQILGWAEFCGLRIVVEPGVFVPRRRSELLVREAIALVRDEVGSADHVATRTRDEIVVVDLCCGSGAIGAAIAAKLDRIELHAADIDPVAVMCARRNIAEVGGQVYEGDLDEPLPDSLLGRVDLLVANVPYVPTDEIELMPPEAREHEPRVALDGGPDGLDIVRRIARTAPRWLAPSGHVLVETSERQAPYAADAFADNGLISKMVTSDEFEATTVIGSRHCDGS